MHKIIAHRGMSTLAPENTMAAFNLIPQYHVHWLETDIAITKDQQLVILHDGDVSRTTNGKGKVTELTFDQLRALSAGSWFAERFRSERIPTFDEVIDFINRYHINVNLEIKPIKGQQASYLTQSLISQLARKVNRIDSRNRVIISSFYPRILSQMKAQRPDLEYACLFSRYTWPFWRPITRMLGTKIIHPDDYNMTARKIRQLKKHGFEVNVWTVDRIDRANQLFNWGADGIFTDISQDFPEHRKKQVSDSHFLTTWF